MTNAFYMNILIEHSGEYIDCSHSRSRHNQKKWFRILDQLYKVEIEFEQKNYVNIHFNIVNLFRTWHFFFTP
jgi:hypothetical protein